MHVAPADFRTVRTGGVTIRFAILGDVAYALADIPPSDSPVPMEDGCEREHWGFVVDGSLALEIDDRRETAPTGTAFHVPAGLSHRMIAPVATRVAGFGPMDNGRDVTDAGLRRQGFEIVSGSPILDREGIVPVVSAPQITTADARTVVASARRMGDLLFSRVVLGRRGGFTSSWCDVPHWGIVTSGEMAIEAEDDVEVLTTGDVFYCTQGPPGHRFQSAEGATLIDFTPLKALRGDVRCVEWRLELAREIRRRKRNGEGIAIAPLG